MPIHTAIGTHFDTLLDLLGRQITYRRGADHVQLAAAVGNTRVEVVDEQGTATQARIRDYIVRAADLKLAGVSTEPERDDLIEDGDERWAVMPAGADKHFRNADHAGVYLRIHTTRIQ